MTVVTKISHEDGGGSVVGVDDVELDEELVLVLDEDVEHSGVVGVEDVLDDVLDVEGLDDVLLEVLGVLLVEDDVLEVVGDELVEDEELEVVVGAAVVVVPPPRSAASKLSPRDTSPWPFPHRPVRVLPVIVASVSSDFSTPLKYDLIEDPSASILMVSGRLNVMPVAVSVV